MATCKTTGMPQVGTTAVLPVEGGKGPSTVLFNPEPKWRQHSAYTDRVLLQEGRNSVLVSCYHKPSKQTVVVKAYGKTSLKPYQMAHVYREVGLLAMIQANGCQGVVQLLSAWEEEDQVYLVFHACMRGDLYQLLMKEPEHKLPEKLVAASVALPLVTTLAELHKLGVVHRDVKPENVFIDLEGHVVLGDFGLAASLSDHLTERVGTLDYLSAEVLAMPTPSELEAGKRVPREPYNEKVDVWALGCLCYELLVGKPPFEVPDPKQTAALILSGKPAVLPEGLSAACCDFIRSAMTHNPKQRPSAAQLLQHPWLMPYLQHPHQQRSQYKKQSSIHSYPVDVDDGVAAAIAAGDRVTVQLQHKEAGSPKGCQVAMDDRSDWSIGTGLLEVHEKQQQRAHQQRVAQQQQEEGGADPAAVSPVHAYATAAHPRMVGMHHTTPCTTPLGLRTPCSHGCSSLETCVPQSSVESAGRRSHSISNGSYTSEECDIPLHVGARPHGIRGARRASSGTSEFLCSTGHTPVGTPTATAAQRGAEDGLTPCASSVTYTSHPWPQLLQEQGDMGPFALRTTSSCNGVLEGAVLTADPQQQPQQLLPQQHTEPADMGLPAWHVSPGSTAVKRTLGKSRFAR